MQIRSKYNKHIAKTNIHSEANICRQHQENISSVMRCFSYVSVNRRKWLDQTRRNIQRSGKQCNLSGLTRIACYWLFTFGKYYWNLSVCATTPRCKEILFLIGFNGCQNGWFFGKSPNDSWLPPVLLLERQNIADFWGYVDICTIWKVSKNPFFSVAVVGQFY